MSFYYRIVATSSYPCEREPPRFRQFISTSPERLQFSIEASYILAAQRELTLLNIL